MTAPVIPASLFPSLDVMLLEGAADGSFTLLGEAPAWVRRLWPEAPSQRRGLHPERTFLFLEHFLPLARTVWANGQDASVTSEMWTEVDETGREWLLEARALQLAGRSLLLLKFPTVAPENLREVLQQSRELNLEHYRLRKEIDRREVLLHCLVHDLSTPLASIKGSLRLLVEDEMVRPGGDPLVQIGLRQIEKLREMVREMLTGFTGQARPAQRLTPQSAPDLAAAIRELTTGLTPTATLKNVRFQVEADPSEARAWPVVGESTRLERVLFNLFENALRYAPAGTDVLVRLVDEGRTIRLSIEDAGEGVPEGEVERLFRKFAQGSGQKGQVGLGLYFCRITIEGWGGTIGYAPSALGGACFWFRLPKPQPED